MHVVLDFFDPCEHTRIVFAPLTPSADLSEQISGEWYSSTDFKMQDLFISDTNDAFFEDKPYWSLDNDGYAGFISMFEYEYMHFDRVNAPNAPFGSGTNTNAYQAGVCGTIEHVITGIAGDEI